MYTLLVTFFCIPKTLAASQFPVSTQSAFTNYSCFSRNTVPIGFCCGGFSSTAGYVPGNEAQLARKLLERLLLSFSVVPCQKVFPVFIRQTLKKFFNPFLSQAFRLRFRA